MQENGGIGMDGPTQEAGPLAQSLQWYYCRLERRL